MVVFSIFLLTLYEQVSCFFLSNRSCPQGLEAGDFHLGPRELLSFGWQVARGMDYLASIKVTSSSTPPA